MKKIIYKIYNQQSGESTLIAKGGKHKILKLWNSLKHDKNNLILATWE